MKEAQEEAKAHRDELDSKDVEDLFGDADEEGLEESSAERVTDDEMFDEKDFETLQEYVDDEGNERFWEVEESYDIENEEATPKKVLRDPGEPTKQEWEEHFVFEVEELESNIDEVRREKSTRIWIRLLIGHSLLRGWAGRADKDSGGKVQVYEVHICARRTAEGN